jgi:hypothetical protein
MDLLEQVAKAGGKILRVERYVDRGQTDESLISTLLLTFDVGRVLIWVDKKRSQLAYEHITDPEDLPRTRVKLDQEEPWWRIIGSPLTAVRPDGERKGCQLQFRADEHNPRYILLVIEGDCIRVGMKKP